MKQIQFPQSIYHSPITHWLKSGSNKIVTGRLVRTILKKIGYQRRFNEHSYQDESKLISSVSNANLANPD